MGDDLRPRKTYRNSPLHVCTCEVLREQREKAGMTQFGVSALMGKRDEFCNRVEHGARMLNHIEYMYYCRAIQTSAAFVSAESERRLLMKNQPLKPTKRR